MSNQVRIVLIVIIMALFIVASYWYMQETTGKVGVVKEQKWRLHDQLLDVSFAEETAGWAVGRNGTVLCSEDGGKSWAYQRSNTNRDLMGVFAINKENSCAVGTASTIMLTQDGGKNWRHIKSKTAYLYNDVFFISPQDGFIVGEFESILRTTDGGTNWELIHGGEPEEIDFSQIKEGEIIASDFGIEEEVYTLKRIYFLDSERGWTVGEYGTILSTLDGGKSWRKEQSGTENSLSSVEFLTADLGFAVGLDGTILKSTDGGVSWSKDKPTVKTHYYDLSFKRFGAATTRNDAVAVGQGIIASWSYFKNTYLQNWVPALEMIYRVDYIWLNSITFINKTGERAIAVGDQGLILWSDNGGDEWDIVRYPEKSVELVMAP
ncbi:MAG: hypothetical protein GY868_18050 [Deltaproteobacteria bacterium]|nr:hypothetical protein [Deltaproteobacteria bacterium]